MKKQLLFIASCYLLSACSSSESITPTSFFKCKINGNLYSISGLGAYSTVFSTTINQVYGTEVADSKITSPRTIYLSIEFNKGVGTHTITGKTLAFFEDSDKSVYNSNFNNILPEKGTLTITEKTNKSMKGTFSFQAFTFTNPIKKITVTEGEFSVLFR